MSCGEPTTLGVPEPAGDTSPWIQALERDPDGQLEPGYRNGDLLALHRRPPTPPGAVYREQVVYGRVGQRDLTLRLYARACPGQRRPAVLFLHGGGWVAGDPSMHTRHAHGLAERGFVTAIVSYRLYPEVLWPEPLHDAKCAVRWLRANAAELGADAGRIAIAGLSAGGQLAALTATTPGWEEGDAGHGSVSSACQAMVLWSPVVEVAELDPEPQQVPVLEGFFGGPLERRPRGASPLEVVAGHPMAADHPPPALLLTGDEDATVPLHTVVAYAAALRAAGGHVEQVTYPGREHAFNLVPGDWEPSFLAAADFLERVLGATDRRATDHPATDHPHPTATRHGDA